MDQKKKIKQQEQNDDEFELDEQTNGKEKEKTIFESLKELGMDQNNEPNLQKMKERIEEIIRTLVQFKEVKEEERSRQSYIDELMKYLCAYYGYNSELIEMFVMMFHPNELVQFLDSNESQRPITLRVNSLKSKRKELAQNLISRGVNLDPLADWSKVGLKVYDSKVPLGATPEYLAGHYMLQSASSFLPVIALNPIPGDKVIDLAAAPGGKTTYIAQMMKNQGILVANDLKKERLNSLKFNLQRMGVQNSIVCNYDGRKLPTIMKNFDKVLLDSPCTGLGIISRDPSIKASRNYKEIRKMSHLQKELILAAIDMAKEDGIIVYSTCSIMVQENEDVINYALKNRFVKVLDLGIELGEEGITKYNNQRFDENIKKSRRIYPHLLNMDGFYVCKLKKIKNGIRKLNDQQKEEIIQKNQAKKLKKKAQQDNKNENDNPSDGQQKINESKKMLKIKKKKQLKQEKQQEQPLEKEMSKQQQAIYEKVKQVQLQEQQQIKHQIKDKKINQSQQDGNQIDKKKEKNNKNENEVQEQSFQKKEKEESKNQIDQNKNKLKQKNRQDNKKKPKLEKNEFKQKLNSELEQNQKYEQEKNQKNDNQIQNKELQNQKIFKEKQQQLQQQQSDKKIKKTKKQQE